MMSTEMKRVYEVAEEIEKKIAENSNDVGYEDSRYRHYVILIHEEGTTLFFKYAFLMLYHDSQHGDWGASENPGEWVIVFTEHHGIHVYPMEDLILFKELKSVKSERILG